MNKVEIPADVSQNLLEVLLNTPEGQRQFKTIISLLKITGKVNIEAKFYIIKDETKAEGQ